MSWDKSNINNVYNDIIYKKNRYIKLILIIWNVENKNNIIVINNLYLMLIFILYLLILILMKMVYVWLHNKLPVI